MPRENKPETVRVLIVDDHKEHAENVAEMLISLESVDVEYRVAEDAKTAIEVADDWQGTLDVAFVDLRLPDTDGIALLHALKARSQEAQVVLMTGYATVESAAAALDGGAFAFVLKPFKSGDFLRTTLRALEQVSVRREHRALAEQLELSERRHRELVETIPAMVLALDANDRITIFNKQLEELTGLERSNMLGQPGRPLIGETNGPRSLETRGGTFRMIQWQRTTFEGPHGPTTYAIGLDVTDEQEIERRTRRAERLAAVGTLAAGLAHEVRNPLNSANLQLQVLKRRLAKGQRETALEAADLVAGEIRRLDRLVSDFLAFARPQPLAARPTDPTEFLETLFRQLGPEAEGQGVQLSLEVEKGVQNADLEEERMCQVILNLARNSLEALGAGGHLTLRVRRADHSGSIRFEVEDDGPGFPVDAPVFDAFYTTKPNGTGLGLAIAHRIVGDHGGVLSVDSHPGNTRFTVAIPMSRAKTQ